MTATDAPTVVAVVHVMSSPVTVRRGPYHPPLVTPTCCVCGPLTVDALHREDALDVRRDHMRDVTLAAVADDAGDNE